MLNKEQCEEESTRLNCFWLYSSKENSIDDGACHIRTNETLECSNSKRSTQCLMSGVNNLGEEKCIWLLENTTNEKGGVCKNKVKKINNHYYYFYYYYYYFYYYYFYYYYYY
jgi:hypothetical protein